MLLLALLHADPLSDSLTPPPKKSTMLASASAGMIARIPCHPLDTCKARLQAQVGGQLFNTVRGTLVQTVKREGFGALYKGFGITMLGSAPATCLYLTSYEAAKGELRRREFMNGTSAASEHFVAGMLAEMISCVLFVPIDVIKVRSYSGQLAFGRRCSSCLTLCGQRGRQRGGHPSTTWHAACPLAPCLFHWPIRRARSDAQQLPPEPGVATAPCYHCPSTRSLPTNEWRHIAVVVPTTVHVWRHFMVLLLSSVLTTARVTSVRSLLLRGRSGCKSSRRRCCAREHREV